MTQIAIAKATVGRANTTHIVMVIMSEDGKPSPLSVSCGSRLIGSGFFLGEKITRTIDTDNEKLYDLYPEVFEKLSKSPEVVCKKCLARVA